jgi:hypothetical protein
VILNLGRELLFSRGVKFVRCLWYKVRCCQQSQGTKEIYLIYKTAVTLYVMIDNSTKTMLYSPNGDSSYLNLSQSVKEETILKACIDGAGEDQLDRSCDK